MSRLSRFCCGALSTKPKSGEWMSEGRSGDLATGLSRGSACSSRFGWRLCSRIAAEYSSCWTETRTVPPMWGRPWRAGRRKRRREYRVVSCWHRRSTRRGSWPPSNRCGVIAASGATRSPIRIQSDRGVRRRNWRPGWSTGRAIWRRPTNRPSAGGFRCRQPTDVHDRFGNSRIPSEDWSAPWGLTSLLGRHTDGLRVGSASGGGRASETGPAGGEQAGVNRRECMGDRTMRCRPR